MSTGEAHTYGVGSHGSPNGWTEERVAILKRLWVDGRSATEIAERLGGGLSRNAVIGKIHRLKLDRTGRARRTQEASQQRVAAERKPEAARVPQSKPRPRPQAMKFGAGFDRLGPVEADLDPVKGNVFDVPLDAARLVPLVDATADQCKWPIGDETDLKSFRFCGCPAVPGKPYCATHTRRSISAVAVAPAKAPGEGGQPRPAKGANRMLEDA